MSDPISFTVFKGAKADGKISKHTTTKPTLTGDQVHLRITASGLCGTDLHYRQADIGLGHEGVGIVIATGPNATVKAGDRVGWGYQHDSCRGCQQCLTGRETYCAQRKMYGSADVDQGSFGSEAVWSEAFLFRIPDALSDAEAAPLMCGGATVFNALHAFDTQPTERVGIVGVGGLGHLAIQFAAKMGAEVVVFSGSERKRDEAMKLGAAEFHATGKGQDLSNTTKPVDRLLVTTSVQIDWAQYLPVLAPNAVVIPLSVSQGDFKFPYMALLANGIRVQGSIVGARWVMQRMLAFAARHDIKPVIQEFPMTEEGIEEAMAKLDEGDVRYRAVLIPKEKL